MARKSIKGYAEKNYYDNTRFSGGVVATNDPLNEGYFKSLVNFDISDTGASIHPRKGFFTTTFKVINYNDDGTVKDEETYILDAERTIYFYNVRTGTYIFIDTSQTVEIQGTEDDESTQVPLMLSVDFDIENTYMSRVHVIRNFENLTTISNISTIYPIQSKAELAIDQYSISKYITKVKYNTNDTGWISFTYREKGSTYQDVTYSADTLTIEMLDFSDTVSIDMNNRNLASFESIIPTPMQIISSKLPKDEVDQFPLIYVKKNNINDSGPYLLQTSNTLSDLYFIPHFRLRHTSDYNWAYTYDIISTSVLADDNTVYRSPIYFYEEDYPIEDDIAYYLEIDSGLPILWTYLYKHFITSGLKSEVNNLYSDNNKNYLTYLTSIDYTAFKYLSQSDIARRTLIVYVSPNLVNAPSDILSVSHVDHLYEYFDNRIEHDYDVHDDIVWQGRYPTSYIFAQRDYQISEPKFYKPTFARSAHVDFDTLNNVFKQNLDLHNYETPMEFLQELEKNLGSAGISKENLWFYPSSLSEINKSVYETKDALHGKESFLTSRIYLTTDKGMSYNDLLSIINVVDSNGEPEYNSIVFKVFNTLTPIRIEYDEVTPTDAGTLLPFFPRAAELSKDTKYLDYYMMLDLRDIEFAQIYEPVFRPGDEIEPSTGYIPNYNNYDYRKGLLWSKLFYEDSTKVKEWGSSNENSSTGYLSLLGYSTGVPLVESSTNVYSINCGAGVVVVNFKRNWYDTISSVYIKYDNYDTNCFKTVTQSYGNPEDPFEDPCVSGNPYMLEKLRNEKYFDKGISITFYMLQIPSVSKIFSQKYYDEYLRKNYYYDRELLIKSTPYFQYKDIIYDPQPPTTMVERLTEEPTLINNATESLLFRTTQGDRLVVYKDNSVFISEPGKQNYFKYSGTFSYPETIVKVIQYKDTLLVFTTQNLYSVYPIEITENVQTGTDSEGNAMYTQITTIEYGSLPVLYNLLVNEKYKDAIQVYNQMVLFYSADGQMFMIKPTATIDSNTRFSIQYFNKNANDILLNYTDYIRDRLRYYGYEIDESIEQALASITIKVSVSLNNIKIFYCVPGIMTYILVYDIINNRYYVYDTLSFTNVKHLEFIPDGELYIVEHNNQLYFTQPYVIPNQKNNNVDLSYFHSFTPEHILTELDTGIENLNNHLKKRFRDLHIIYKNISAESIEFSLDVFVDNIPICTYINPEIQVQDSMYTVNDIYKTSTLVDLNKQMLNNNNALFDFSQFNSSKILTHKTNIISRGKTIRTKLCFKSDGVYKIQGYGLIYKEHTV